ncbi:hypothetical protein [Mycobacterium sp. PSTR-4-N]|uniref:hypothetical protein n=1 Tax=Mycobacterium sp. PSTR-4-N TaxID=2917745 RepID=UPI001F14CADB|nr:hypothetical protein [Mycobacterium sp. PSTR-4-N]MCG7592439.1 hypothetical protein [Mycobacterium sp. PSTR-4-N]
MSATSGYPTLGEWFRRLFTGEPHQIIGGADDPYLLRWYVIPRNPLLNVYVHKFCRSDDDRALHDHPWWFVSLMLRGQYDEVTNAGTNRRRAGSIAYRPAEWRHRVQLLGHYVTPYRPSDDPTGWSDHWVEQPCWTLIVTGRRVRTWGFWCRKAAKDVWDIETYAQLDAYARGEAVMVDRFIPWTEFGDAGCGETS